MDLEFKLKTEHSKESAVEIAEFIMQHPEELNSYIDFLESDDELLPQRAAWPLQSIIEAQPKLLEPHYHRLLKIANLEKHPAVRRNILRIFQFKKVNSEVLEDFLALAFPLLQDPTEAIAIRVYAMQGIYTNCQDFPELLAELRLILVHAYPTASKGFKSRADKILDQLESELNR